MTKEEFDATRARLDQYLELERVEQAADKAILAASQTEVTGLRVVMRFTKPDDTVVRNALDVEVDNTDDSALPAGIFAAFRADILAALERLRQHARTRRAEM